jgi:hypothetical protein
MFSSSGVLIAENLEPFIRAVRSTQFVQDPLIKRNLLFLTWRRERTTGSPAMLDCDEAGTHNTSNIELVR